MSGGLWGRVEKVQVGVQKSSKALPSNTFQSEAAHVAQTWAASPTSLRTRCVSADKSFSTSKMPPLSVWKSHQLETRFIISDLRTTTLSGNQGHQMLEWAMTEQGRCSFLGSLSKPPCLSVSRRMLGMASSPKGLHLRRWGEPMIAEPTGCSFPGAEDGLLCGTAESTGQSRRPRVRLGSATHSWPGHY